MITKAIYNRLLLLTKNELLVHCEGNTKVVVLSALGRHLTKKFGEELRADQIQTYFDLFVALVYFGISRYLNSNGRLNKKFLGGSFIRDNGLKKIWMFVSGYMYNMDRRDYMNIRQSCIFFVQGSNLNLPLSTYNLLLELFTAIGVNLGCYYPLSSIYLRVASTYHDTSNVIDRLIKHLKNIHFSESVIDAIENLIFPGATTGLNLSNLQLVSLLEVLAKNKNDNWNEKISFLISKIVEHVNADCQVLALAGKIDSFSRNLITERFRLISKESISPNTTNSRVSFSPKVKSWG